MTVYLSEQISDFNLWSVSFITDITVVRLLSTKSQLNAADTYVSHCVAVCQTLAFSFRLQCQNHSL